MCSEGEPSKVLGMTPDTFYPAVLIVGAGPAGLVLALTLLRNNVPIRIVDKRDTHHGGARATTIQPRTLEVLSALKVLDDVLAVSYVPPPLAAVHPADGGAPHIVAWHARAEPSPSIPHPSPASTSQAELERVLRKHLERLGGEVELGAELVALEQDHNGVTATLVSSAAGHERVRCAWVVGADGAEGPVRDLLGISLLAEPTRDDERLVTADAQCDFDRNHCHMWGSDETTQFRLKPLKPAPLCQIQVLTRDPQVKLPTDAKGIQELFHSISKRTDICLRDIKWIAEWRANLRMADTYNVGRAFLVGDSAHSHSHSPVDGQGMNAAIQDSFNLAWKLVLAYRRVAKPALFASYEMERMPVAAEMLGLSAVLSARMWDTIDEGPQTSTLDPTVHIESAQEPEGRPSKSLLLGAHYRWSPIVLEGRPDHVGEDAIDFGFDLDDDVHELVNAPVVVEVMTDVMAEGEPQGTFPDDPELEPEPIVADVDATDAPDLYAANTPRLRAGDRAPDAPGLRFAISNREAYTHDPLPLHALLSAQRHTVVIIPQLDLQAFREAHYAPLRRLVGLGVVAFAFVIPRRPDTPEGARLARFDSRHRTALFAIGQNTGRTLTDRERHAGTAYEIDYGRTCYAVVRPDGVIGAYAFDVETVLRYFEGIVSV